MNLSEFVSFVSVSIIPNEQKAIHARDEQTKETKGRGYQISQDKRN